MNCRGLLTVDPSTQQVTKNVEYYLVAHFSKFVQRGATVLETISNQPDLLVASFINLDGSVICVVYNRSENNQMVQVGIQEQTFEFDLFGKSLVTFKLYPDKI
jgi:glucosylceramidase